MSEKCTICVRREEGTSDRGGMCRRCGKSYVRLLAHLDFSTIDAVSKSLRRTIEWAANRARWVERKRVEGMLDPGTLEMAIDKKIAEDLDRAVEDHGETTGISTMLNAVVQDVVRGKGDYG